MRESSWINTWRDQGIDIGSVRTQRRNMLEAIEERLEKPVPENIRKAIEGTNSLDVLKHWYRLALRSNSIAELRAGMKIDPPIPPEEKTEKKPDPPQDKPDSATT